MMWRVVLLSLFILAGFARMGASEVTIYGYVYYWNLERASASSPNDDPNGLIGGMYLPVRRTLVEVEFLGLTIDEQVYTDDFGRFSVTHRDPLVGDWSVNVEVRAEVRLDTVDDVDTLAQVWESRFDLWPYNGETSPVTVSDGETRQIDVWIGGPSNNIASWWYGTVAENHAAFFISQVLCDAYDWLTTRGVAPKDIVRDTSIFFPDTSGEVSCYNSTLSPPGIAWIDIIDFRLYPGDFATGELPAVGESRPGASWYRLRCNVLHEYAHKVMHDVYWAWPRAISLEKVEGHQTTSCINPELGWVEGWAEFLPAAILDWPTINGRLGGNGEDNLEFSYHPSVLELQDAQKGSSSWRDDVSDGCRQENEAENAAVLWDLFDETGWECLPNDQQVAAEAAGWPAELPLRWNDLESDPRLSDVWSLLRDHNPDCLTDESDLWEDSFWYYWQDEYRGDDARIHGLKAILFNRGISTESVPERAPERLEIGIENAALCLGISERDAEDRPFLFYNVAYGRRDSTEVRRLYDTDQPVVGEWQPDPEGTTQYSDFRDFPYRVEMTGLALPRASAWDWLVVVVHDNMECVFATLENPGGLPDTTPEKEGGPHVLPETNERREAVALAAGVYTGTLGEKGGPLGFDLADWYKLEAAAGTVIHLHLEVPANATFYMGLGRPFGPGTYQQNKFSGAGQGQPQDIEYAAPFSTEYFIEVWIPRISPPPAGPYTLTIELTPP